MGTLKGTLISPGMKPEAAEELIRATLDLLSDLQREEILILEPKILKLPEF